MGLTMTEGPKMEDTKRYDEQTSARLWLTSDKKVVVSEGDVRARFLLSRHGPVSRAEAQEIRRYKDGDLYLYGKGDEAPAVPPIQAAPHSEEKPFEMTVVDFGPDDAIDFGAHSGTKVRDLSEEYLRRMTYVQMHENWAKAEEARREGKPAKKAEPAMPSPDDDDDTPLTLGPDDIVGFGKYEGKKKAVRDLPDSYLKKLANGSTPAHVGWAKAEIARRAE